MRKLLHVMAAGALATACTSSPTGAGAPTFLTAAVEGAASVQYTGDGSFQTLPPTAGPVRFTLHSRGTGASADHGFFFHSAYTAAPVERSIGTWGDVADRAVYWYDEGSVRRIFTGLVGTLRIEQARRDRIEGTFRMTALLTHVCEIQPGFPAPFLVCEAAPEEAPEEVVEVSGTFAAGPLGGHDPGLTPSPY
jgi:hypothetical protein